MAGIAFIVALALLAIALFFFLENRKLHERVVVLDGELKEAKHAKKSGAKKSDDKKSDKGDKATAADSGTSRELDEARSEVSDLKKQVYDLKKESKDLRKQLSDTEEDSGSSQPDSDVVFELREEIGELKAEVARLEDEAKANKSMKREKPKPEKVEEPKREAPPASGDVAELREKYEAQISELEEQARKDVRDLEKRLKSTASNVDKQRRRADNNDRAYKITQRQYDVAQERVEYLEAELKKAGFAVQVADTAEAASEAPPREQPKAEEPKTEEPKAEEPKAEEPKAEESKTEESKAEEPKAEEPKAEEPAAEAPPAAAAASDSSEVETVEVGRGQEKGDRFDDASGSTQVLSGAALARAAESTDGIAESSTAEAGADGDRSDATVKAKPVAATEEEPEVVAESTLKSKPVTEQDVAEAASVLAEDAADDTASEPAEEEAESGSTQVLSAGALGAAMAGVDEAVDADAGDDEAVDADDDGGATEVVSGAAFDAAIGADAEDGEVSEAEAAAEAVLSEAEEDGPETAEAQNEEGEVGRRPSSGLFGIPADVLAGTDAEDDEQDKTRSTQFAFPGALAGGDEDAAAADADDKDKAKEGAKPSRLGGRLGDSSGSVDDAWADIDID